MPLIYAGKGHRQDTAADKIAGVGLAERSRHCPNEMSGGEQQRTAIARALVNDPLVVIADEPTGNLDSKTAEQVFQIFYDLVEDEGKTLLMVTHDAQLADRIPRQINIVNGYIVEDRRPGPTLSLPFPASNGTPVVAGDNGKLSPIAA